MKTSKKKNPRESKIFKSIRKPTAPPTRKFGGESPEKRLMPSLRKSKHKKPPEIED